MLVSLLLILLIPMAAAPQIRGGQSVQVFSVVLGTAVSSVQQGEYSRVVQKSNTAWGQVSDNHRWTQHRSFAVSGKLVMAANYRAARRCPRELLWDYGCTWPSPSGFSAAYGN
jgi:hypothetical protein